VYPTASDIKQNQCQFSEIDPKILRRKSLQESNDLVEPPEVLDLRAKSTLECLFFATNDH
jgi:hypothetical protein